MYCLNVDGSPDISVCPCPPVESTQVSARCRIYGDLHFPMHAFAGHEDTLGASCTQEIASTEGSPSYRTYCRVSIRLARRLRSVVDWAEVCRYLTTTSFQRRNTHIHAISLGNCSEHFAGTLYVCMYLCMFFAHIPAAFEPPFSLGGASHRKHAGRYSV